jgi:hypothetical protein
VADIHSREKHVINVVCSIIAIGVILICSICEGTILGVDLKYTGRVYTTILIVLNIFKREFLFLFLFQ